jgi:hypothetical protein
MKDSTHIKRFNESEENLNSGTLDKSSSISDVSDSLLELENYIEERISILGEQIDKFPDAPNMDIILGRLQEAKEIRVKIWRLGKLKNIK